MAGIAYNFLPFTALPLYVSLEKIDRRVVEAANDLYASKIQSFFRVIFPLTVPGIFAAFLLTFVPAVGDYVNATILGGTGQVMIGNIIQNLFLINGDYPGASALSAILMGGVLVGIFLYARVLGARTIEEYIRAPPSPPTAGPSLWMRPGPRSAGSGDGGPGSSCPSTRVW